MRNMLTRRELLTGMANLNRAFAEYRKIHPDEERPSLLDLFECISSCRGIERLAKSAGIYCKPEPECFSLVYPYLRETLEALADSPCPEKT